MLHTQDHDRIWHELPQHALGCIVTLWEYFVEKIQIIYALLNRKSFLNRMVSYCTYLLQSMVTMDYGSWYMDHGPWAMVHRTWTIDHSPWSMDQ